MAPVSISGPMTLRPDRTAGKPDQLGEVAARFEAIFMRQILSAARENGFGGGLFESQGDTTFRQMLDEHFADLAADKGALGLGKTIEHQLSRHISQQKER